MNKTLMKGCGIGCGVVALLMLVLVGGGAWFAREMGREYKAVQESEKALVEAEGDLAAWAPPAGLVPTADRLALFLTIREANAEWRTQLETDMARFRAEKDKGGVVGFWNSIRAGSDMGLTFARYWGARNRTLTDRGMGPGEYAWLYGLTYYAFQGRDPAAGAQPFDFERGGGVQVKVEVGRDDPAQAAKRRVHDLLAPFVEAAAPADDGVTADELAAEQVRLADDPLRAPWQDSLPGTLAAAIAPFAPRLDATWSEAANPLELMFDLESWSSEPGHRQD